MPFEHHNTLAFTAASVRKNAPALSGVYGISNANEWIYVGQCDNMQNDLLQHLSEESDSTLKRHRPTGFTFEICAPAARDARQDSLVRELAPVCNRNAGGLQDEAGHSQNGPVRRRFRSE